VWLELVTDNSGQNISHQFLTQAMKHTRRANTSTTPHQKSEVLHDDENSTFMAPLVSPELKSLRFSHTYNNLYLHQTCYYRSPDASTSQQSFLDQIEAASSSKIMVSILQCTWHHIPEAGNLHQNLRLIKYNQTRGGNHAQGMKKGLTMRTI